MSVREILVVPIIRNPLRQQLMLSHCLCFLQTKGESFDINFSISLVSLVPPRRCASMIKTAKQLPLLRSGIALFRSLLRQSYHTATIRLYRMDLNEPSAATKSPWQVELNQHQALAGYDPQVGWQSTEEFRRCAHERFARSETLFSISVDQTLAHYGWVIYPTRSIAIPEVAQHYELPERSAYLYDFFTHPAFRQRGMYQASLQRILAHLSTQQCPAAYIGVAPSNVPSSRVIEKLGFQPSATLGYRRIATNVRRWVEDHAAAPQHDLR